MGQEERRIAQLIRQIAQVTVPIVTGRVMGVDVDEMTCTIQLTQDEDDVLTEGVTLNVKVENASGCYMMPSVNADCIVALVDGQLELLKASEYDKVVLQANAKIQMNDGSYEGLVKVVPLVGKINIVENDLNDLKSDLSGVLANLAATIAGGGGTTPITVASLYALLNGSLLAYVGHVIEPTLQDELENRAVIHG